jgi:hypothetical protein
MRWQAVGNAQRGASGSVAHGPNSAAGSIRPNGGRLLSSPIMLQR